MAATQHIDGGDLSLALGDHPVLHARIAAGEEVGETGDITRRVNTGSGGLHECIHLDAPIDSQPGILCQFDARTHAGTDDDNIGFETRAIVENHIFFLDGERTAAEVENDAARFMLRPHEITELGTQRSFQRSGAS